MCEGAQALVGFSHDFGGRLFWSVDRHVGIDRQDHVVAQCCRCLTSCSDAIFRLHSSDAEAVDVVSLKPGVEASILKRAEYVLLQVKRGLQIAKHRCELPSCASPIENCARICPVLNEDDRPGTGFSPLEQFRDPTDDQLDLRRWRGIAECLLQIDHD